MAEYVLKPGDIVLVPNKGEVQFIYKRITAEEIMDEFMAGSDRNAATD